MTRLLGVSSLRVVLLLLPMAAFQSTAQEVQPLPPGYVGSEPCKVCHEDIYNAFAQNPHNLLEPAATPGRKMHAFKQQGCESCHGPAEKHTESASAADIRDPEKLT